MVRIRQLESILVDLPTIRAHRLANQTVTRHTLVVLRLQTDDGLEGLGEATTIGGLSYGEEGPETIKVVLDEYIAPLLVGQYSGAVGTLMALLERHVRGNRLAKSAVETALLDLKGQLLGVPVSDLFGGARTETLEVAWGLATGNPAADLAEAEQVLADGRHRLFKIKVGAGDPEVDVARVEAVAAALGTRARVRVDANQAWDEPVARRAIERLEAAGVELIEQPVVRHDHAALARLSRRFRVPLMADEAVATPADAFTLAQVRACDVFALKIAKSGGLSATARVAAVAEAAGIQLYGGTMLEGTIGTLASAHLFAALPQPLAYGTELFGPLLLQDDVVTEGPAYADFTLSVPAKPGLGVCLDEAKLAFYRRDRHKTNLQLPANAAESCGGT
jgi:muconate cycloisomerase